MIWLIAVILCVLVIIASLILLFMPDAVGIGDEVSTVLMVCMVLLFIFGTCWLGNEAGVENSKPITEFVDPSTYQELRYVDVSKEQNSIFYKDLHRIIRQCELYNISIDIANKQYIKYEHRNIFTPIGYKGTQVFSKIDINLFISDAYNKCINEDIHYYIIEN